MNGGFSEARTYVDTMKGTLNAKTIAVFSEVVTLAEEARPLLEDDNQENVLLQGDRWAAVLVRAQGLARRIAEVESGATRPTFDFSMLQRNPILFPATIEPDFSLAGNLMLGRHKNVARIADEAIRVNPLGEFHIFKAITLPTGPEVASGAAWRRNRGTNADDGTARTDRARDAHFGCRCRTSPRCAARLPDTTVRRCLGDKSSYSAIA